MRIGAVEGLAFLAMSVLVIAALIGTLVGTQRQVDRDFQATAAELRLNAGAVESLAVASNASPDASPYGEGHQAVLPTGANPMVADGER